VSPAERPCSLSPLNAISVDCTRAPKRRTRSFWLSKSITKYARFLNFGSLVSSFKIGVCALQVGHHEAWMAIKIGFPAFWASANVCALNGCGLAANAGDIAAVAATIVTIRMERRDSMGFLLGSVENWLDRFIIGCTSHLGSANSHLVHRLGFRFPVGQSAAPQ